MRKRIILTGGGTAGHIWPLLSVYEKIKNEYEILFLGTGNERERELVEKYGIKYKKIFSGKLRRYFSLANFIDPFKVILGFLQSIFIILRFRPSIIFAKGGYVTVPVGLAAKIVFKKIVIHESDVIMGLSNRILSKFAKEILVAFPVKYYPKKISKKSVCVGVPIRPEILTGDKGKALDDFDFKTEIPTILFIGGSSGAHKINQIVWKSLPELLKSYQVIHITGTKDYSETRKIAAQFDNEKRSRYRFFDFITKTLPEIYSLANIVVARSGATSLFELSALRKPTIFIPYPYAASNHQYKNAKVLEKSQAAIIINESEITNKKLVSQIKRLVENDRARNNLRKEIEKYYKKDSVDLIAEEIDKLVKASKGLL